VDHTINTAPLNSDTSRGQVQAQLLHRDGHKWMLDLVPELENEVKTIWALSEFTERTGATKVIRGSHHWPSVIALSPPSSDVAESVEMRAGSCLIYTSGVLHAGGNNQSDSHRMALTLGYNLAFLKSADAVCLFSPPYAAGRLPEQLQRLIGYGADDVLKVSRL
jgi:ectoine hydroxylase-related dioxygenase (phytanoyl-CoA dioxygenase family)